MYEEYCVCIYPLFGHWLGPSSASVRGDVERREGKTCKPKQHKHVCQSVDQKIRPESCFARCVEKLVSLMSPLWDSLSWTRDWRCNSTQHECSMPPTDVRFLMSLLPEPTTIWMIDRSPLDCGEREQRSPQRRQQQQKWKGREERGASTVPQGQSDVQPFVFSCEISGPVQLPVDKQSNWWLGRNRCSYTTCSWLVT